MSSRSRKGPQDQPARGSRVAVGRRAVLLATLVAVFVAAVLIGLSWAGAPSENAELGGIPQEYVDGTSLGSPDAPVTITMFAEFQCGFCQLFSTTTEKELRRDYIATGKVRFVFKHFVMFGDESMQAALASEAAAEQNKFWEYHDLVMAAKASHKTEGDLPDSKLQELAVQAGLDMDEFNAAFQSGKYKAKVDSEFDEAMSLGLRGTPTSFINGAKVEGYMKYPDLKERIDKILAGTEGMTTTTAE